MGVCIRASLFVMLFRIAVATAAEPTRLACVGSNEVTNYYVIDTSRKVVVFTLPTSSDALEVPYAETGSGLRAELLQDERVVFRFTLDVYSLDFTMQGPLFSEPVRGYCRKVERQIP